jgi:chromosome segregation ATPase
MCKNIALERELELRRESYKTCYNKLKECCINIEPLKTKLKKTEELKRQTLSQLNDLRSKLELEVYVQRLLRDPKSGIEGDLEIWNEKVKKLREYVENKKREIAKMDREIRKLEENMVLREEYEDVESISSSFRESLINQAIAEFNADLGEEWLSPPRDFCYIGKNSNKDDD